MPTRGRPTMNVRMPQYIIDTMHEMAKDRGTTVSDIVRALIEDELKRNGYPITPKPIEGQVKLE